MDSRLRKIQKDIQAFAKERKLRPDWHEPDNQEVDAFITGHHLDNAFGSSQDGLPEKSQEYLVVLTVEEAPSLFINLADLLAIACSE